MKKYIYPVIALAVAILLFTYFTNEKLASSKNEEIKIGVIATLSGQYSFVGDNMVLGAQLYQKEWNEKYADKKITLIVENDDFDAKKGVSAYKKLTEIDKVDAIYNLSTPTIDAIYNMAASGDKPIVQLGVQSTPATDDSIFNIIPDQMPMYHGFGEFVKSKSPVKPVLLSSSKVDAYNLFANAFKEKYGTISEIKLDADQTSAKTLALKMSKEKYTDYIVVATPQEGAIIIKELLLLNKDALPHFYQFLFLQVI